MKIVSRCLLAAVMMSVLSSASAGPTGLIVIPTADIRDRGTYEVELQHDGRKGFPADAEFTFLNTLFGVMRNLEAGVDFELSNKTESEIIFNYKVGLPLGKIAAAFGTYNIGENIKPVSYLVTGLKTGRAGLHIGAQRSNGDIQLLLGAHRELGRLLFTADYTSGDENFSSGGFEYALSEQFALQWGALFPNASSEKTQFTVHLIYNSKL